jgi:hypothetical protein
MVLKHFNENPVSVNFRQVTPNDICFQRLNSGLNNKIFKESFEEIRYVDCKYIYMSILRVWNKEKCIAGHRKPSRGA